MLKKTVWTSLTALVVGACLYGYVGHAAGPSASPDHPDNDENANYDVLDGHGTSHVKVDVVSWQGNLELHVYPPGSLKGLSLKLDKHTQGKPVMVIGYRFNGASKPLIRRAILDSEHQLNEGFKVYRDPATASEKKDPYDKIIISNTPLTDDGLVAFRLDPPPSQMHPDGPDKTSMATGDFGYRGPAGGDSPSPDDTASPPADDDSKESSKKLRTDESTVHEMGSSFDHTPNHRSR